MEMHKSVVVNDSQGIMSSGVDSGAAERSQRCGATPLLTGARGSHAGSCTQGALVLCAHKRAGGVGVDETSGV
eukprot:558601-Pleurochrysis_carterae.AAC.6